MDVEVFKYYIRQDYLYLIEYSRMLALASARAPDLDTMGWFAKLLDGTLNIEMDLHRSYCAQFGITTADLEGAKAAPTTLAYTNFLLNVAHQGSFSELAASFLPCQWGYWEIGDHLSKHGAAAGAPLYAQWIGMYTDPEYVALAQWARSKADQLATEASPSEVAKMEETYLTSFRYEYLFWDMAYRGESWVV